MSYLNEAVAQRGRWVKTFNVVVNSSLLFRYRVRSSLINDGPIRQDTIQPRPVPKAPCCECQMEVAPLWQLRADAATSVSRRDKEAAEVRANLASDLMTT